MFRRLLVANRGEIGLRVARACRELGVEVVAVYSTADRDSPLVAAADVAVHIGPPPARSSYLNIPNIVEAARATGAEAVHPGYGFLSEDPDFAQVCAENDLVFVGPPADVMARLGNKATARSLMAGAGLPLLPGVVDPVESAEDGAAIAAGIGYPVVIKATAGGGGRGITVVHDPADFAEAWTTTRRTAHAVFRDPRVYVESYVGRARHIEVQILVDAHGNGVHLGERDCSLQRRHQKLLEEAPAVGLTDGQRADLGAAAVRGALAVGYTGAGTVEFLMGPDGRYAFMEMNARIQVEHPVTEMVTGVDLVQEQIRIAAGEPLSIGQSDVAVTGASIECRINAEDPERGFAPTPGRLEVLDLPGGPGVRVDSGYTPGGRVSPDYDSLVAKVIVWGADRRQAVARMRRALGELHVAGRGVTTTRELHQRLIDSPTFRAGEHHTGYLDGLPALTGPLP